MKKIALFTTMILLAGMTFGQRFAFIDSDYIMENIPEYKAAEQELERISVSWQTEIEQKFSEVDRLYREYQAEAPLLPLLAPPDVGAACNRAPRHDTSRVRPRRTTSWARHRPRDPTWGGWPARPALGQ